MPYVTLLLTWFKFNPSMDKWLHPLEPVVWNYSSISICTVEVWEWMINFIPLYCTCDYLSMLGLKLIHVSKRGPKTVNMTARWHWLIWTKCVSAMPLSYPAHTIYVADNRWWTAIISPHLSDMKEIISIICSCINTLRPRQDGHHFPDDIFKCIFLIEMYKFRLRFHSRLFLRVQLRIFQNWFR